MKALVLALGLLLVALAVAIRHSHHVQDRHLALVRHLHEVNPNYRRTLP